jgi:hypothetical protein
MSEVNQFDKARPIFVVGAPRSGTTLCARILGEHPSLFAPGETHFMEDIYSRRREIGDLQTDQARQTVVDRLSDLYGRFNEPADQLRIDDALLSPEFRQKLIDGSQTMRSALLCFMDAQTEAAGKSRWINHTPQDIFYTAELASMYAESRFILCVRDPRDFLLSYKLKWRTRESEDASRLKSLYHPIITSLLWKASSRRVIAAQESLAEDRTFLLRYEDLVSQPAETIRSLCEFLDEPFSSDLCELKFSNSSHSGEHREIHAQSIGRGRSELSAEEIWWAERLLRKEMLEFGYATTSPTPAVRKLVADVIRLPVNAVRALAANRAKTGPTIPYLFRRLRGLLRSS